MAFIPFPNVPKAPGVPALPRSPAVPPVAQISLSIIQGIILRAFQVQTRWGIFDSKGNPLGDPAKFTGLTGGALEAVGLGSTLSTSSLDFSKETRVSDFPIEAGSFASYNKVEQPASPLVTLALSGSENDRRAFLAAIDAATVSTELYSVVTPEKVYINYSVERYNYQRRNSKGATLLIVEITLKEIRQVSALYSQSKKQIDTPKNPGASPTADNGKVQAAKPKTSVLKSISKKIPSLLSTVNGYIQGTTP